MVEVESNHILESESCTRGGRTGRSVSKQRGNVVRRSWPRRQGCVRHPLSRVAHPTNGTVKVRSLAELDEEHAQVLRSILEGFRALLLTDLVTSNMLSEPAFAELVDASSPRAAMDLVQIIQDQLIALS
jgi:hypothetical protein